MYLVFVAGSWYRDPVVAGDQVHSPMANDLVNHSHMMKLKNSEWRRLRKLLGWEEGMPREGMKALYAAPQPLPIHLFIWLFIWILHNIMRQTEI